MNTDIKYDSRQKLLGAALKVIREKGYAAMRVDDICAEAGLTKGGFFHHFKGKEDFAVAAANYWSEMTGGFFASAPYHLLPDPLDRVLGYIDFRKAILRGSVPEFTCLVGTMVQEAFATSDAIRAACEASINAYCEALAPDIEATMARYGAPETVTALGLAQHIQAVLQGSFILAKTTNDPAIARESVTHLKRYVRMLFEPRGAS